MTKKVQMRRMRKIRVSENVKDNEYVPGAFVYENYKKRVNVLIEVGRRLEQQIPIQLKEIFVAKLSHKSPHTFHLNKLDPKFDKGCLYEL